MMQTTSISPGAVRITHRLPASPERVFAAWTDEAVLMRWLRSPTEWIAHAEMEFKVGGSYRWSFTNEKGEKSDVWGEFVEVDSPRRLAFTWNASCSGFALRDSLVTVEIEPAGAGAAITLTHERLPTDEHRKGVAEGWAAILPNLEASLTDGGRRPRAANQERNERA